MGNYHPTGKINWARFLAALIFPFAASATMAWVLDWAYFHRWYYSFIVPALAALVVGTAMYLAVVIGH